LDSVNPLYYIIIGSHHKSREPRRQLQTGPKLHRQVCTSWRTAGFTLSVWPVT